MAVQAAVDQAATLALEALQAVPLKAAKVMQAVRLAIALEAVVVEQAQQAQAVQPHRMAAQDLTLILHGQVQPRRALAVIMQAVAVDQFIQQVLAQAEQVAVALQQFSRVIAIHP
jgi:hypothetical protein